MIVAKKVIIARSIGDTQLCIEKLQRNINDNRNTMIPIRNPITSATEVINKTHIRSILGGPSNSSGVSTVVLSSLLFSIIYIIKYERHSTNRDQYIRKIQDCKIFYRDKIHNMPYKNALIRMRDGSRKNEYIPSIDNS